MDADIAVLADRPVTDAKELAATCWRGDAAARIEMSATSSVNVPQWTGRSGPPQKKSDLP